MSPDNSTMPTVSVLMCVHNGKRFLHEAVDSILNQTFRHFEFLIIDDGSTDGSGQLLDEYGQKDPRVRIIHQANRGLTNSLNIGLGLVRGRYVARLDADDISEATRLAKQVEFLERHADHVAVGCSALVIDECGRAVGRFDVGAGDRELAVRFLGNNYVIHGSVMFRIDHDVRYNPALRYAQDYDFWVRLLATVGKLANLGEPLYQWRQHAGAISATKAEAQRQNANAAADLHCQNLVKRGRHDIILEAYLRHIAGGERRIRWREILKSLPDEVVASPEARINCVRVSKQSRSSAQSAVRDFLVMIRLTGFSLATAWLFNAVYLRIRRSLAGKRHGRPLASLANASVSND